MFFRICLTLLLCFTISTLKAQSAASLYKEGLELKKSNKNPKAIKKFEEALDKAKSDRNTQLQMDCHLELAELKNNVINYKDALLHYEEFTDLYRAQLLKKNKALSDSVVGLKTVVDEGVIAMEEKNIDLENKKKAIDSLTTEQLQAQLAITDLELQNQKHLLDIQESENRRNMLMAIIGIVLLMALFLTRGYVLKRRGVRIMRDKNYQIAKEKEKSDELLLNILPEKIANELKEFGRTTPLRYETATVMFTDFKGFTKFSESHSPEELVTVIDYYFSGFDRILSKYRVEKIKTIGDAYLCVSGIPDNDTYQLREMLSAAFEMMEFVKSTEAERSKTGSPFLQMRVGIHCGSLVAGVVGSRKFAYDIWGDTVNIAARMEQSSEPGCINVSETVYELAKNDYDFEFRGEVDAKNKGKLKMYYVTPKS